MNHVELQDGVFDRFTVRIERSYPHTEVVIAAGDLTERTELWGYDDTHPGSLDREYTSRRLRYLAASMALAMLATAVTTGRNVR